MNPNEGLVRFIVYKPVRHDFYIKKSILDFVAIIFLIELFFIAIKQEYV